MLLDIAMPDMDGMQALATLWQSHPGILVIMVTASGNPATMAQATTKAAAGTILRETSPGRITRTIRTTYAGQWVAGQRRLRAAFLASPESKPKLE